MMMKMMMTRTVAVLVVTASLCIVAASASQPNPMYLHLMTNKVNAGAVCLDGTPAGFYFAKANAASTSTKWQIYFQGGGWCYDETDCWGRSKGSLGSSTHWGNVSEIDGLMSSDCSVNPTFCTWNRVHIGYCDGNSFSGDRDEPITVNGDKVYFRGKRIIDATLETLMDFGLADATDVMLTGCSAGGLATYLHADYVGDVLKQNVKSLNVFKAVSISGFFLLHNTVEGKPVYPNEMAYIYQLSNATVGLNQDCIASKTSFLQWQCNFAQESYAFIKTPLFVLNSALDSWQTGCIFTSEPVPRNSTSNGSCGSAKNWGDCNSHPDKCDSDQMAAMVSYEADFMRTIKAIPTFYANGNGAFIYSCHTHCAGQSSAYNKFAIGGVTMEKAVSTWWLSDTNTPASSNTHEPCFYSFNKPPYDCNPSCGASADLLQESAHADLHKVGMACF